MGNSRVGRNAELAAIKFANAMEKYPQEVAVCVGIILPNLINGCSWGFVRHDNEEFVKCLDLIEKNPNITYTQVRGGYLVVMNLDYLLNILNKTANGLVTSRDLELAGIHRKSALAKLENFMRKGKQGKIGIYNLNDTPYISVEGVTYNAFCVTFVDLLTACVRNNYRLVLGGVPRTPDSVSNKVGEVIKRLEVAPSGRALFIEVCKAR